LLFFYYNRNLCKGQIGLDEYFVIVLSLAMFGAGGTVPSVAIGKKANLGSPSKMRNSVEVPKCVEGSFLF